MSKELVEKFSPYIMFHKDETCFPITIDEYLSVCKPININNTTNTTANTINGESKILIDEKNIDEKTLNETPVNEILKIEIIGAPTSDQLYDAYKQAKPREPLKFKDPVGVSQATIKGSPQVTFCYAKVISNSTVYRIIYYYVFSHTEPYKCCYFGFPLNQWAHRGDIKFILVEVDKAREEINRIYFGAHSTQAGCWRDKNQIKFINGHPVAWAEKGDHSFYPDSGMYPRIYFVAIDDCSKNTIETRPQVIINHEEGNKEFIASISGWNYWPGTMNDQGVNSPNNQGFWHGFVPEVSNNWWKRLLCCNYF